MTEQKEKEVRAALKMAFENVACLGRDAYGAYSEKMVEYIVGVIKKGE